MSALRVIVKSGKQLLKNLSPTARRVLAKKGADFVRTIPDVANRVRPEEIVVDNISENGIDNILWVVAIFLVVVFCIVLIKSRKKNSTKT